MHLELDAQDLSKVLAVMSKITDKAKDIHQMVLLKAVDGMLECKATNGVVFAKKSVPASVAKDGEVLVSCSKMASLTEGITTPITLKADGGNLLVTSANSKCKLGTTDVANFPSASVDQIRHVLDVPRKSFLSGLNKLGFLTKSKIQNPNLDGVALFLNDAGCNMYSSDSIKLAMYSVFEPEVVKKEANNLKITIPSQAISVGIIKALFDTVEEENFISIFLSNNTLVMKSGVCIFTTSISALPFPEVVHLFQQPAISKVVVNRHSIYKALNRIVTIADSLSAIINLTVTSGQIILTSVSSSDEAEEHLECDYSGEDVSFKIRASDITCYQSGLDQVVLELQDKRVVITDGNNYKLLIPKCF